MSRSSLICWDALSELEPGIVTEVHCFQLGLLLHLADSERDRERVSEEEEGEGRESVYQLESVHLHQSSSVEIVLISRVSRNILRVVAQDLCRVPQDIAMLPHSMDTLRGSMDTRQRS
jgi:hypothetical protein